MNNTTSTPRLVVLKQLEGNAPVRLDPIQQALKPYLAELTLFWVAVWFGTAAFVLVKVVREYLEYRKKKRK